MRYSGPGIVRIALMLAATAFVSGCSLQDVDAPALSGPSELSTSVTLAAVPDILPRDGRSQAVVTLTVRDASGRPVAGQRLTLGVSPTTAGLSVAEVVTDASGRATVTVTAPPSASTGNTVTVSATPIGTGAESLVTRNVSIALSGTSNTTVPTASFTVSPTSPEVNQLATLDASASTDEGAACLDACTYTWDLGGEASRSGRIITYRFQSGRVYNVALTVTDAAGSSATTRTNVTVTAAARPTVSFTVSPTSPVAGQIATFNATTSVATNHTITRFDWNFGEGSTTSTTNSSVNKTFSTPGTYNVTVTVTDDLGQMASSTIAVTVTNAITPTFTFSPTNPRVGDTVFFNAVATTSPGAAIEEWEWDFGDGTVVEDDEDAQVSHVFDTARTFVVRLTVTDSQGRTGTTTQTIAIAAP